MDGRRARSSKIWRGETTSSPSTFREFIAPHSHDALEGIEVPRIHFGVGTGAFLDDMRLGGLADAVGVDWRMPLDEAAALVGPDVTLVGGEFVPVPATDAVVDRNLVTAPAWPGDTAIVKEFAKLMGAKIEI